MADVFISYHDKTNGDRAEKIAATLESAGITCWYARRDVPAGGDFTHEVITQIENCKIFLLLLDDGAARSPHVETEVANAFGHKKIMPYQTDKRDVKRVKWVPYYLKQIQIVPFSDYDTLTKEVATALGRPVETVTPKPKTVAPKPQLKLGNALDKCAIFFTLLVVIGLSVVGCLEPIHLLPETPLYDVFERVLNALLGYYWGGFITYCMIKKISADYGADIFHHTKNLLESIMKIWLAISFISVVIIGYMTEGVFGVFAGLAIICTLCFIQAVIMYAH